MRFLLIICLLPCFGMAQKSLEKLLEKYNAESVPYISVEELKQAQEIAVLLDARELEEYNISHLPEARFAGYNHFDLNTLELQTISKDTLLVVYCSLGIRSEDIAEKLQKAGFTNVKNLYGGIFEWKNKEYEVVDSLNISTEKVHAFSKHWSQWLKAGEKYIPSPNNKFPKK